MMKLVGNLRKRLQPAWDRKGVILVLAAGALLIALAFAMLTIDIGYITLSRTQMQNAADAAALAAANELSGMLDREAVEAAGREAAVAVAAANRAGDKSSVFIKPENVHFGRRTWNEGSDSYDYNFGSEFFPYNVVRVDVSRVQKVIPEGGVTTDQDTGLPLFFAPVMGIETADVEVRSYASFQPRDIMIVLDFSASMNDDSTFAAFGSLGKTAVEANLQQIWQDLGSPTYGNMTFTPKSMTMSGQAASGTIPHIDVTWGTTTVDVVSTKTISSVKLTFSNGNTQTISHNAKTGTFKGSGSNNGKDIVTARITSGSNNGETFDFNSMTAKKKALGLTNVAYPYNSSNGGSGSWDDYIEYVDENYYVKNVGYRRKYGMMTLIQYWLDARPGFDQTPDLWKTRSQPAHALKEGVSLLIDYLRDNEAEDNVGLSVYNSPSGDAILESGLTADIDFIETTALHRQPGHYDPYTNIGAGMKTARLELMANARPKAFRLMVLMTDGVANRPSNETVAKALVRSEAALAADNRIEIMTISVGAGADEALMQEVADTTGGLHFNVPGGQSVSQYAAQLQAVFANIAADRPLRLIRDVESDD